MPLIITCYISAVSTANLTAADCNFDDGLCSYINPEIVGPVSSYKWQRFRGDFKNTAPHFAGFFRPHGDHTTGYGVYFVYLNNNEIDFMVLVR